MTIGERLKSERQRIGMNQDDFSAVGGVLKAAQINYEKNKRAPDTTYLLAVGEIGVDIIYVLTGKYSGNELSKDESFLLNGYRGLDERGKAGVMGLISGMSTSAQNNVKGDVGQIINGDLSTESLSFTVGGKKKK
nr:helix-turn-helix domain-containing protein [uncultured Undibacterium sp.]